jgi:hypothetical protein
MGTTMDEDDEGEGRQLTVLGNDELDELEVSYEELAQEKALLTERQIHQLTVVDIVRLTDEQFAMVDKDLLVTRARELIEQAAKFDEVKGIGDMAARKRFYAQQMNDKRAEVAAVAIQLRAKRRLGLMLAASPKAKGGDHYHTGSGADPVDRPATYKEIGIKSKRAQNELRVISRMSADQWDRHETKILENIQNPKPKSPKPEPVVAPDEGVNLGIAYSVVITANKDILNHKAHKGKITRADLDKLRKAYEDGLDIIEEVYDDIEEQGVVNVKSSSATLDLEGL